MAFVNEMEEDNIHSQVEHGNEKKSNCNFRTLWSYRKRRYKNGGLDGTK